MESFIKLSCMKILTISVLVFLVGACTRNTNDDTPTQTIITSDSSNVTGRLKVEFNDINGNQINQASASLFISYHDMKQSIPLYTFTTNLSGNMCYMVTTMLLGKTIMAHCMIQQLLKFCPNVP